MEKSLKEQIYDILNNKEILSRGKECKSIDDLYAICSEYLLDVSKEEFREIVMMNDSSLIDEHDLESVAGGLVCTLLGETIT